MVYKTWFIAISMFLALNICCSDKSVEPFESDDTFYNDDIIVISKSEEILGEHVTQDTIIYDLTGYIENAHYHDAGIAYYSDYNTKGYDIFVYNINTGIWDQLAYQCISAEPYPNGIVIRHLFSGMRSTLDDYIADNNLVKTRGGRRGSLTLFELNKKYTPKIIMEENGVYIFICITYGDNCFYLSSPPADGVYKLSSDGEIDSIFSIDTNCNAGLAFDGEYLWVVDGDFVIRKMNEEGVAVSQFALPIESPAAMTYGNGYLWLTQYYSGDDKIFCIDPIVSCDQGVACIVDTLDIPGVRLFGITWANDKLLVQNGSYCIVSADGTVENIYSRPSNLFGDVAWDGENYWSYGRGLPGYDARNPILVKIAFR